MDTLIFIALIPIIGFIIAIYLDLTKPQRDLKEKNRLETILGKEFNLEDLILYEIKHFGIIKTKSNFNNIISFMNRINKDTSRSDSIYKKYFNN